MSGSPRVRNLPELNTMPKYGHKLVQAIKDLRQLIQNVGQQTNATPHAIETAAPPQINSLKVTAGGGVAHIQITDENPVYRGISYHALISANPGFTAPVTIHMGPSRDIRVPVGSQPLYYAAFSDYPTSAPSAPMYHGGAQPVAVTAIGTTQPLVPSGQGSGTGYPGQISGHGIVPFRGEVAPRRS